MAAVDKFHSLGAGAVERIQDGYLRNYFTVEEEEELVQCGVLERCDCSPLLPGGVRVKVLPREVAMSTVANFRVPVAAKRKLLQTEEEAREFTGYAVVQPLEPTLAHVSAEVVVTTNKVMPGTNVHLIDQTVTLEPVGLVRLADAPTNTWETMVQFALRYLYDSSQASMSAAVGVLLRWGVEDDAFSEDLAKYLDVKAFQKNETSP
jgi:hypothetical protein